MTQILPVATRAAGWQAVTSCFGRVTVLLLFSCRNRALISLGSRKRFPIRVNVLRTAPRALFVHRGRRRFLGSTSSFVTRRDGTRLRWDLISGLPALEFEIYRLSKPDWR